MLGQCTFRLELLPGRYDVVGYCRSSFRSGLMSKDVVSSRPPRQEERYFQQIERELIEKLRKHGEENSRRRALSEQTGIIDPTILADLRTLGYTTETLALLYLVPIVQVAWADGHVSDREQKMIEEIALARGIDESSPVGQQLRSWLAQRPSDADFDKTMRVIGAILQARSDTERAKTNRDLLSLCTAVADASGGILGIGRVSPGEKQLLARIAQELEQNHREATLNTVAALASES